MTTDNIIDHVTLESINEILMAYINDVIQPSIIDNGNNRPVPLLYGTPERWASIRKLGFLRDATNDKLLTPAVVLQRTSVTRGKMINPNNKYLYKSTSRQWNVRNSYDRFSVQNKITPSVQIHNVMIPDYVDLSYDGIMWTEYQEQMDALIEQFNVENYEYWGKENNYKFRISIDGFNSNNELPATDNRAIRIEFKMIVNAYLLPERVVSNFKLGSTSTEFFTYKKIIMKEKIVATGDLNNKNSIEVTGQTNASYTSPMLDVNHFYALNGSFADRNGGPSLTGSLGTTGLTSTGYNVKGFQYLTGANIVPANNYTIALRFAATGSLIYQKIIDFKNRVIDDGVYLTGTLEGNSVVFYFTGSVNYPIAIYTTPVFSDYPKQHVLVVSRETDNTFSIYVDGVQFLRWDDTLGYSIFSSTNNLITLFADDLVTIASSSQSPVGEIPFGTVTRIATWNRALSPIEVSSLSL